MLDDLIARLAKAGVPARAAMADTAGAAWALARYGRERMVVDARGGPRPARAPARRGACAWTLRPPSALGGLGLRTIGALAAVPRAELSRRFGPLTRLRLDQALGRAEEAWPSAARRPPSSSAWPSSSRSARRRIWPASARRVGGYMRAPGARRAGAARRFELSFHRLDGRAETLDVGTALPSRDPSASPLFAPKLETVDPGFGVEAVTLRAESVETWPSGRASTTAWEHDKACATRRRTTP